MKSKLYFLLLALLVNATSVYSAAFKELKAPNSRRLLHSFPNNFKGNTVIFFHGATGNAQGLLNDLPTADIIQKMLDAGFFVVLPEARQNFKIGSNFACWESSTAINPDTQYIDWIINTIMQVTPQLKALYLMGGSNGVAMASRMTKNRNDITGLIAINGPDADQFSVNSSGSLVVNETFNIPANHAPILMISSKQDTLMPFSSRQKYIQKVRQAGVSAMVFINELGNHYWGEWTMQYHDDIVGWMNKQG